MVHSSNSPALLPKLGGAVLVTARLDSEARFVVRTARPNYGFVEDELASLIEEQAADLVGDWPARQRPKGSLRVVYDLLTYGGADRRVTRLRDQVVRGEPLTARDCDLATALLRLEK